MRNLGQLPEKVRYAAMATVTGAIAENPRRAGKPLKGEFMGLWSARRGDYRIVYKIMEEEKVVMVHRIQHRRHTRPTDASIIANTGGNGPPDPAPPTRLPPQLSKPTR